MANYFKHKAVHHLQGAGHSTPGNWGRPPIIELGEQRKQRTSLNMVSAKILANGYQPVKGETWGKANTLPPSLRSVAHNTTQNNPQQNHTPRPNFKTHFFAVFFQECVDTKPVYLCMW